MAKKKTDGDAPTKETDGDAPAKKSKKKLIIIVAVLVLALGGGGYTFLGGSKSTTGAAAAAAKPSPGLVLKLDPVNINLATGHYLKLGLALQATKSAKEVTDGSKALDLAIALFSNKPMSELATDAGRLKYKTVLVEEVAKAYEEQVYDVYFTEFVMQ